MTNEVIEKLQDYLFSTEPNETFVYIRKSDVVAIIDELIKLRDNLAQQALTGETK